MRFSLFVISAFPKNSATPKFLLTIMVFTLMNYYFCSAGIKIKILHNEDNSI